MTVDMTVMKAVIAASVATAMAEIKRKQGLGICVEPECEAPAFKDASKLVFGDDHCEHHARAAELEMLQEVQQDDDHGIDG